ncbi:MAG: phosphatase PAP2 family protein [Clostridia bacterium]|nr:phosphatase PAP2 family protein [Clostridia bacterium]
MKKNGKITLFSGVIFNSLFIVWTFLITTVDVKSDGVNGTDIGFATINTWFHNLIGVNMTLYTITDWLGLVPVFICMIFGVVGLIQLIKRKSLLKVDFDIVVLGVYYVFVVFAYLLFEMIPINYRPILINGFMEASYPSSTTLLVLSVMPTLVFQVQRRLKNEKIKIIINIVTVVFSLFMVIGRLVSGVHWVTDIIGSCLLSAGLFFIYKSIVLLRSKANGI